MKYLLAILLLIPTVAMAESYVTDTEVIDVTATAKADKLAGLIAERDNAKSVADAWLGRYQAAVDAITSLEAQAVTVEDVTADIQLKASARIKTSKPDVSINAFDEKSVAPSELNDRVIVDTKIYN